MDKLTDPLETLIVYRITPRARVAAKSDALAAPRQFRLRRTDMEEIKRMSLESGDSITFIVRQLVSDQLARIRFLESPDGYGGA